MPEISFAFICSWEKLLSHLQLWLLQLLLLSGGCWWFVAGCWLLLVVVAAAIVFVVFVVVALVVYLRFSPLCLFPPLAALGWFLAGLLTHRHLCMRYFYQAAPPNRLLLIVSLLTSLQCIRLQIWKKKILRGNKKVLRTNEVPKSLSPLEFFVGAESLPWNGITRVWEPIFPPPRVLETNDESNDLFCHYGLHIVLIYKLN